MAIYPFLARRVIITLQFPWPGPVCYVILKTCWIGTFCLLKQRIQDNTCPFRTLNDKYHETKHCIHGFGSATHMLYCFVNQPVLIPAIGILLSDILLWRRNVTVSSAYWLYSHVVIFLYQNGSRFKIQWEKVKRGKQAVVTRWRFPFPPFLVHFLPWSLAILFVVAWGDPLSSFLIFSNLVCLMRWWWQSLSSWSVKWSEMEWTWLFFLSSQEIASQTTLNTLAFHSSITVCHHHCNAT